MLVSNSGDSVDTVLWDKWFFLGDNALTMLVRNITGNLGQIVFLSCYISSLFIITFQTSIFLSSRSFLQTTPIMEEEVLLEIF